MWEKIKSFIIGKVIMSKVLGKFVKHATGVVVGLLFGAKLAPYTLPIFEAMGVSEVQVEAGLVVGLTALFGAVWNYLQHRLFKK